MEHPPKQGLKQNFLQVAYSTLICVLMEHPPKQGLKQHYIFAESKDESRFNGTSTKTRIETLAYGRWDNGYLLVLMEHPPKQGLKHTLFQIIVLLPRRFNGTSTKTRIETP